MSTYNIDVGKYGAIGKSATNMILYIRDETVAELIKDIRRVGYTKTITISNIVYDIYSEVTYGTPSGDYVGSGYVKGLFTCNPMPVYNSDGVNWYANCGSTKVQLQESWGSNPYIMIKIS